MHRPPPLMPTDYDQRRVSETLPMKLVLDDDWRDVAREWMESFLDPELLDSWGEIDTSDNVFGAMATALSQPGHYSRGWEVRHTNRSANRVTGPTGMMATSGYPSRMTFVERYAWGLVDQPVHIQAPDGDTLRFQPVCPTKIYAEGSADDPSTPVALWHLRWRYVPKVAVSMWCWDKYDIRNPKTPTFHIEAGEEIEVNGEKVTEGEDLTADVLGPEFAGPYQGDAYPWRAQDKSPLIPYAFLRTIDSGRMWTYMGRYGCFKATLVVAQVATYVLHAARDASGSMVLTYGLERPATQVERRGERNASNRIVFSPGMVAFLQPKQGAGDKIGVHTIGPGANLQPLTQFLHMYRQLAAERCGVSGGSAIRNDANPTSASALLISENAKMSAVRAADPLFRKFDADVMRVVSAVLRPHGVNVPESGYTFEYYNPPPTPAEMRERREQEKFDEENGYASKVSNYMARHEGASRADALKWLSQVEADRLALEKAVSTLDESAAAVSIDVDEYDDLMEEMDGMVEVITKAMAEDRELTEEEKVALVEGITEVMSIMAGDTEVADSADGEDHASA